MEIRTLTMMPTYLSTASQDLLTMKETYSVKILKLRSEHSLKGLCRRGKCKQLWYDCTSIMSIYDYAAGLILLSEKPSNCLRKFRF